MEKDKSSSELANRKSYDYKKHPLFFKNFRKNKLNLFGPWKSIYIINSKLNPNSTWSNIYNEDIYRNRIDDRSFVSELSSERINKFLDFYFPFNLPIDFNDRNKIFIINKNNQSIINNSFKNESIINSYSSSKYLTDLVVPSVINIGYESSNKKENIHYKPLEIEIFPEIIQANIPKEIIKPTELLVDFNTKKVAIPSNVLVESSKSINSLFSPTGIEVDYVSIIDKITPNNIEIDNLLNIPKQIISIPNDIMIQTIEVYNTVYQTPISIEVYTRPFDIIVSTPIQLDFIQERKESIPSWIEIIPSEVLNSTIPSDIGIDYQKPIINEVQIPSDISLEVSKLNVMNVLPIEVETLNTPSNFLPEEISLQYDQIAEPIINRPANISLELSTIDVSDSLPVEIETINELPTLLPNEISLQYQEIIKPTINNPADISLEVSKIDVLDSLPIELGFINSNKQEFTPSNIDIDFQEQKIFELSTPNDIEINDNLSNPIFSPSNIELELSETLLDEPYKQTVIIEKEIPVEVEKNIYIPVEINKPYEVIKEVEKIVYVDKPYEVIKEVPILSIKEIPIIKPVEIFIQEKPEIIEKEKYIIQDNIKFVDLPKEQDIKYVQTYQEIPSNQIKEDKPISNDKDQDVPILIVPEQNESKVLNDTESIEISTKKVRQKNKKPYITLYNGNKPMTSDNIIEKYSLDKDNLGLMKIKKRRSKN